MGSLASGKQADISTNLVDIGVLQSKVDDQLSKVTPGEITVKLQDPGDLIWTFIKGQLAISGGLLPPFLQLQVGGNQVFLGIVDPSRIVRHLATDDHSIELGGQDWSVMLANQYLDTWTRPVPRKAANRPASSAFVGYSAQITSIYYGTGTCDVIMAGVPNVVGIGDRLTAALAPGLVFTVLNVQNPPASWLQAQINNYDPFLPYVRYPSAPLTQLTLSATPWTGTFYEYRGAVSYNGSIQGITSDNFTRLPSATTDQDYFVVKVAVGANPSPAVYSIQLDTVDGVTAQDVLRCIQGLQSASWTVLSVNPELLQVNTKEAVTNLDVGDRIYFDTATNGELVMQDARSVISSACSPYGVDFSRFIKAPLPMPVFGWLPLQSTISTDDLLVVSDVEPNAAGVRVISGLSNAFHGSPDNGWTAEAAVSLPTIQGQYADWTGQTSTAPGSLMPYEVRSASPHARQRNRCYHDFNWLSVDNGPTPTTADPSLWVDSWTAAMASRVPVLLFYDYLPAIPRKITVAAGGVGLTATPWTGAAWGSAAGLSWPTGNAIESISNFPGGPAGALLAVTSANTLELATFPGSASCAVPSWLLGGVLVPTPHGPYLIGPQGYAQVTYSGGVLALVGVAFTNEITCFWPNTFVARTSAEAVMMGRLDVADGTGSTSTETWLFRLSLPPDLSAPDASIILSEKVANGAPVFAGAILDPSKAGRVVGHYGGRLFQVDTVAPWTVERFTPSGMTALDCLEHVCQLNNAMAVPLPSGTMAIISRGISEEAIPLTVSMVKNDQSLSWSNFYSIVRCTTQDGDFYYDAQGQDGGDLLEISNQPMLWTLSQTGAMAESYVSWFGSPRPTETHTWTWADANTAPPWEGLPAFAKVTTNGTGPWRVMSTEQDYIKGTCTPVLVEA